MCKKKDYTKDVYVQPRLTLTNLKIKPCNRLSFHINEVSNVTCGDFQLFKIFCLKAMAMLALVTTDTVH